MRLKDFDDIVASIKATPHCDVAMALMIANNAPTIDPIRAAGGWISVKERLPEDDLPSSAKQTKVITAIKGKNGYAVRSQLRWKNYYGEWVWRYSAGAVTHWMPLPEPPKEGAE